METSDRCETAWSALAARDFRDWHGWPAGCGYADLDARFQRISDVHGTGMLGRAYRPAVYRVHLAEGYPHNLKVWFSGGDILLVEIRYPSLPHPAGDLLASLGEPEARLDYHLDIMPVPAGAWVYPARGITVFLDAGHAAVMGLALFHAGSLEEYLAGIHPDNRMREMPLNG